MIADLHLHSSFSDGRLDPAALVDVVADAGVQLFALTDHDTTAGHEAARARAKERGLTFIGGIEMTTYAHGQVIHVLGLGCEDTNQQLEAANDVARVIWDANQHRWVDALASNGIAVNWERDFADHPVRLPTLIERLCRAGVDAGNPVLVHRRFRAYFSQLQPQAYEGLSSPAQATDTIRSSGGLAFLAHPLDLVKAGLVSDLLARCDGLETEYLRYNTEERAWLRHLALQAHKLCCGGSDYHGYFESSYQSPGFIASEALLERLGMARE